MKSRSIPFRSLVLCALLLSARMSAAQTSSDIPRVVSYQAVLMDSAGVPVPDGDYSIGVTLYPASADRSLWRGTYLVHVTRGIVNLLLGSGDYPLPNLSAEGSLWLGVRINGGDELPHTELTPSPYALNVVDSAITTAKLANNAVTTSKIADSSITASKVNMDYISSININGVQFTGHGTPLTIQGENGITAAYKSDSNTLVLSGSLDDKNPGIAIGAAGTVNTPDTSAGCINSDGGLGANTVSGGCNDSIYHPIDYSTIGGGRNNHISNVIGTNPSGEYNDGHVIGGGEGNRIYAEINDGTEHGKYGFGTISGGQNNTLVGPEWGVIAGGHDNLISSQNPPTDDDMADYMADGVISGGDSNSITNYSLQATIGGGYDNHIHGVMIGSVFYVGDQSTIGGGVGNVARNIRATIAGGDSNNALGSVSAIGGGSHNTASDTGSEVGGGTLNSASGKYSSIPGGRNLTLGDYSMGFNASSLSTDISSQSDVAYWGNVNLWIGNVDSTARSLRFYS
ncbi:MAG: hypothetical protein ACHQNE_09225, partial [Candidatus Kapaibacterium sp.]